jgi:hypothetical protein
MKNTGGPAFPTTKPLDGWGDPNQGMTLRDYFAAKVMQAFIGSANLNVFDDAAVARAAYTMADAMLSQREKS